MSKKGNQVKQTLHKGVVGLRVYMLLSLQLQQNTLKKQLGEDWAYRGSQFEDAVHCDRESWGTGA